MKTIFRQFVFLYNCFLNKGLEWKWNCTLELSFLKSSGKDQGKGKIGRYMRDLKIGHGDKAQLFDREKCVVFGVVLDFVFNFLLENTITDVWSDCNTTLRLFDTMNGKELRQ